MKQRVVGENGDVVQSYIVPLSLAENDEGVELLAGRLFG